MNTRDTLFIDKKDLKIGGVTASELAKTYGTPLYVYDEAYIEEVCNAYSKVINDYGKGLVKYASKAFCSKAIYRKMMKLGIGLDVVSGGELYTAMSVDFPADKIYFHGNNKSEAEIKMALDYGIARFVVDSKTEIAHLDSLATKKIDVMLRINPGVEAHTHHFIQTAKLDSKFGLAIEKGFAMEGVKAVLDSKNLRLAGMHCHIGSQIFEKEAFKLAAEKMMNFINDIKKTHNYEIDELNLGGGFGIWYSEGDKKMKPSDYTDFLSCVIEVVNSKIKELKLKKPFISVEPGRSIVGEAGITLYTVGNIKDITGIKKYASIDGGMFENPRYALYQAKYTSVLATDADRKGNEVVTLTGKCCESGDMIIVDATLPPLERGDIVAVLSTGAYNHSMASNYNKNPKPPVVFVKDGKSQLVVKGEKFEDLSRDDL